MSKNVFIISGEESGDNHGGSLIRELKVIDPALKVRGMGGERMREEGLTGLDYKGVSVVGIAEVVKKLPVIKEVFKKLVAMLDAERPDCVVLIDFPDFNLRFAKEAKKRGIPVVYYISPQVWAWRGGRVKKIARLVTKMLVVFPFEEEIYEKAGVDVEFVGHPLIDSAHCSLTKNEAKAELGYGVHDTVAVFLPGSRVEEVERLLPVMLEAAKEVKDISRFRLEFLIAPAVSITDELIEKITEECDIEIKVVRGNLNTVLRAADGAAIASGTATLEAAIIGTPMVIVYKLSPLSYWLGRLLVRLEHFGLPNIVAGKKIVEELLQNDVTPKNVAQDMLVLLEGTMETEKITKEYNIMRESLGEGGASKNAAAAIMKVIGNS